MYIRCRTLQGILCYLVEHQHNISSLHYPENNLDILAYHRQLPVERLVIEHLRMAETFVSTRCLYLTLLNAFQGIL